MTDPDLPDGPSVPELPSVGDPVLTPPPAWDAPPSSPASPAMPPPEGAAWPAVPMQAPPVTGVQDNPNHAPVRVGFGEAIKRAYSRYATFSGRASLSEYWWFYLLQVLVTIPLTALGFLIPTQVSSGSTTSFATANIVVSGIANLWSLGNLLPVLAISWRRLHDTNKSGWWYGAGLIGSVVAAVLVVGAFIADFASICSTDGCDGTNLPTPSAGLIGLVVVVGAASVLYGIAMLVFLIRRGDEGANKYGPGYSTTS